MNRQASASWRTRGAFATGDAIKTSQTVLYLTPVIPATTGNGLAMRAGMVLQVLAAQHRVFLLVVALYATPAIVVAPELAVRCQGTAIVRRPSLLPRVPSERSRRPTRRLSWKEWKEWIEAAGNAFRGVRFDIVHVFRLVTLPMANPYFEQSSLHRPKRHLDLDDIESISRSRIATLYRSNGNAAMARFEESEAKRCEALEEAILHDFDRVYVCSQADRAVLQPRARAELCLLPNAVHLPEPCPAKRRQSPFTFLFVGSLGYYPNEDAVIHFCREILPLIHRRASCAFRFLIVGPNAPQSVTELSQLPEVEVIGGVPDLAPWYREADAVVVPIRAGGGTRIKVLEAFSYGRPVVSTSIGIEGVDADDRIHVLIGDTPEAFAERCLQLMAEPELADQLATNSLSLVKHAYTIEAVTRTLFGSA